jgi:uncharacterized damage-inducible protein DinB
MSELFFKQFNLTRERFLKEVQSIDPEIADVLPKGFNNNIHWVVGHVLTVAEQFLFGYPANSTNLPANYKELFGGGTKPADWSGDVPSIAVLIEQLSEQIKRINEIPESQLAKKLEKPFLGFETFGELGSLAMFHEANHLGQIHAMARVIQA